MTTNALVHGSTLDGTRYAIAEDENPLDAMIARLDLAAAELELDPGIYRILRQPERQILRRRVERDQYGPDHCSQQRDHDNHKADFQHSGYSYLMRGSRNPYRTSTSRFMVT